jgi:hypothetical protein
MIAPPVSGVAAENTALFDMPPPEMRESHLGCETATIRFA